MSATSLPFFLSKLRRRQDIVFVFRCNFEHFVSYILVLTTDRFVWLHDLFSSMIFVRFCCCKIIRILLLCLLLHLQVKISYLEMSLYEKLKGMKINNERLTLIRYQARKLLTCPMLRGEDVLPLLLATFIFEVLCQEHVTSTVLQAPCLTFIEDLNIMPEDEILGYNCGIKALGKNVASDI